MKEGRCHICGNVSKLTFEHIPPKSSGNNSPAKVISGEQVIPSDREPWDVSGLPYIQQQKGFGHYVLCEHCNNTTGSWYAGAFQSFYEQIPYLTADPIDPKQSLIELTFLNIYPLRVLKQIACMFLGICGPHLGDDYPEMREFVLSKESTNLNFSKYRFCFFVRRGRFRNPQQMAQVVPLYLTPGGYTHHRVSYIDTPTAEFLFEEEAEGQVSADIQRIDLQQFANEFSYDDCVSLKVIVPTHERNSWLPYDVRTQAETRETIKKNKDHKGNVSEE